MLLLLYVAVVRCCMLLLCVVVCCCCVLLYVAVVCCCCMLLYVCHMLPRCSLHVSTALVSFNKAYVTLSDSAGNVCPHIWMFDEFLFCA